MPTRSQPAVPRVPTPGSEPDAQPDPDSARPPRLLGRGNVRNLATYVLSAMAGRAIPFALLPVLTYYLVPEEYAVIALFQVGLAFTRPLVGMNLPAAVTRRFFRRSQEEIAGLLSNVILVLVGSTLGVALIGLLFAEQLEAWVGLPARWLLLLPLLVGSATLHDLNLVVLRNRRRALTFAGFELTNTVVNVAASLVLVVVLAWGWEGRAAGVAAAAFVSGPVGLYWLHRTGYLRWRPRRAQVREVLIVCGPLLFHALGTAVIELSDRLFIDHLCGRAELGVYNVGYQFGMVVSVLATAVNMVWAPWMYEQLAGEDGYVRRRLVRVTYAYGGGMVGLSALVGGAGVLAIPLLTESAYHGATQYVLWVAGAYALRALYLMVYPYLVHEGRTAPLGVITVLAALLNLGANYVLIGRNGPVGAAQATLVAYLFQFLAVWWWAHRVHPMPWSLRRERPD